MASAILDPPSPLVAAWYVLVAGRLGLLEEGLKLTLLKDFL